MTSPGHCSLRGRVCCNELADGTLCKRIVVDVDGELQHDAKLIELGAELEGADEGAPRELDDVFVVGARQEVHRRDDAMLRMCDARKGFRSDHPPFQEVDLRLIPEGDEIGRQRALEREAGSRHRTAIELLLQNGLVHVEKLIGFCRAGSMSSMESAPSLRKPSRSEGSQRPTSARGRHSGNPSAT